MSAILQSSDTRYQGDKEPLNVVGQPVHGPSTQFVEGPWPVIQQQPAFYIPLTPVTQTAPEPNDNHDQFRYGHQQMENPLDSWMTPAVLACLCCCCPLGLAEIFKALDVQKAINNGDRQQAEASSASARNLTIASVICGLVIFFATLLIKFIIPKPDY